MFFVASLAPSLNLFDCERRLSWLDSPGYYWPENNHLD